MVHLEAFCFCWFLEDRNVQLLILCKVYVLPLKKIEMKEYFTICALKLLSEQPLLPRSPLQNSLKGTIWTIN